MLCSEHLQSFSRSTQNELFTAADRFLEKNCTNFAFLVQTPRHQGPFHSTPGLCPLPSPFPGGARTPLCPRRVPCEVPPPLSPFYPQFSIKAAAAFHPWADPPVGTALTRLAEPFVVLLLSREWGGSPGSRGSGGDAAAPASPSGPNPAWMSGSGLRGAQRSSVNLDV